MPARVLIIEDNAANLELMSYLVQAFGHTVLAARDGESGLAMAQNERPDLVLCDIQLPVMDGVEVANRIRRDAALNHIPLLAVTAFAMVGDRETIVAAGFNGYLTKPISPETFMQQIEAFLPPELRGQTTPAATSAGASTAPTARLERTLLVVDNKEANLELARSLFGSSGYRVMTANGMHAALALARETLPDLILSDVCMAEGSGFDFIRAVKADARLRAIPFVFITSTMTIESAREQGMALGADRFIFRPLGAQELLAEIEACLRRGG